MITRTSREHGKIGRTVGGRSIVCVKMDIHRRISLNLFESANAQFVIIFGSVPLPPWNLNVPFWIPFDWSLRHFWKYRPMRPAPGIIEFSGTGAFAVRSLRCPATPNCWRQSWCTKRGKMDDDMPMWDPNRVRYPKTSLLISGEKVYHSKRSWRLEFTPGIGPGNDQGSSRHFRFQRLSLDARGKGFPYSGINDKLEWS